MCTNSERLLSKRGYTMNQIEVISKTYDTRDRAILEMLEGYNVEHIRVSDVYYIDCIEGKSKNIERLFYDALTQEIATPTLIKGRWVVETRYKDAVSDPAAESIKRALADCGLPATRVRTARRYYIKTPIGSHELDKMEAICQLLANEVVEEYFFGFEHLNTSLPSATHHPSRNTIREIDLLNAPDEELERLSREGLWALSLDEMLSIQSYFKQQGRNPTDAELETFAQTWSEHCKHKTFNSAVEFSNNGKKEYFDNLFQETIVAATRAIAEKKDWLVSVFEDNAGIITFNEKYHVAFKVETHNHPSALDPYGGASTGIGGVIRDILGAGLGAQPIFNTDIFCLAPGDSQNIPHNVLHPQRVFRGVVSGIRDYGNRMGIPTVNGAIVYHRDYLGAPLVYCGTGGLLPKGMEKKQVQEGDMIIVVGGKTGRDGIHGATFSSETLQSDSSGSVVQIGNPIEEKKVMDALLTARDQRLYNAITDCGAGGLSSAIGEMGAHTGAEVALEKVPLKHGGLHPWEIWISESQERMVIAAPSKNISALQAIFAREDVTAAVIGTFTATGKLVVRFRGRLLVNVEMNFLHNGLPKTQKVAQWSTPHQHEPNIAEQPNYTAALMRILAHPSVASKEVVIRKYDHEVQGNTIGKPLVGVENDGPSDAAVIRPECGERALVIANGINPRYGFINSYWMAAAAIDEALRNVVASGGELHRTALLDNFCWPSTANEEKLGSLVMAAQACHDMAIGFETPFISGKDSLYNEFTSEEHTLAIPDTLLISAVSVINSDQVISMYLKRSGTSLYILGNTYNELGGSYFYALHDIIGKNVPKVRVATAKSNMESLIKAMRSNIVLSCHDCSEGGIAVAAAEMAFTGAVGLRIDANAIPTHASHNYQILFSESHSRFLIEVDKKNERDLERLTSATKIGETIPEPRFEIFGNNRSLIAASLTELKERWKRAIQW